jgi:hypothetical protein
MGRRGGGGGATEAVREPRRRSSCVEADKSAAPQLLRGGRQIRGGDGSDGAEPGTASRARSRGPPADPGAASGA